MSVSAPVLFVGGSKALVRYEHFAGLHPFLATRTDGGRTSASFNTSEFVQHAFAAAFSATGLCHVSPTFLASNPHEANPWTVDEGPRLDWHHGPSLLRAS